MYSPTTVARLEQLRHFEATRGLTQEESREVIQLIRQGRVTAATISAKSKASKTAVSGEDVLAKLKAALAVKTP